MSPAEPTVSVVLPVHAGVDPDHFRQAVNSILGQTRCADELVFVEDGPLTAGHLAVLDEVASSHPGVVRVRLELNSGAGVANQAGLRAATGEWIAKADADDLCSPDRFERQLRAVLAAGADLCGAAMSEFEDSPDHVVALRANPLTHEAIARRMRWNNPVNHPTAFYRRSSALAAGGYPELRYMQDYDLFARMLAAGSSMMNLPEPLVLFRSGEAMRRRRSGRDFFGLEWALQRRLRRYGLIGTPRMTVNLVLRMAFRMLPPSIMRATYRRMLSTAPSSRDETA